jgi:signal transduction histidine kinase
VDAGRGTPRLDDLGELGGRADARSATGIAAPDAAHIAETLESLSDAVYTLDHGWRFTYLNAEAERLVRRSREELLGCVVWEEFPEAARSELFNLYHRAVADGKPVTIDRYPFEPLGTTFEITAFPADLGLVVQFRDVQEHLDRERQLEARAEDHRRTAVQLRELDATKNAFLSAVSHELRGPLTVVRGFATQLVELRGELGGDERAEMEDTILAETQRLDQLLSDLLDVDRLTRGTLRSRQVATDVATIVRNAAVRQTASDRVDLDVPDELVATVDPSQVERIVANLVGNAGKYAPIGPITVRLVPLGAGVRIEVVDEGPGIPEEERERIFEPLYRVDDEHPRPGTGIGLSLVAAFAGLHGGEARALPSERGAHIQVDLPGADADGDR